METVFASYNVNNYWNTLKGSTSLLWLVFWEPLNPGYLCAGKQDPIHSNSIPCQYYQAINQPLIITELRRTTGRTHTSISVVRHLGRFGHESESGNSFSHLRCMETRPQGGDQT